MPALSNTFTDRTPHMFSTLKYVRNIIEPIPVRPIVNTGVLPISVANNKASTGVNGYQVVEVLPLRPILTTGVLYPSNTDHL